MAIDADEEDLYDEGFRAGYMAGYQNGLMSGIYAQHEKDSHCNVETNTGDGNSYTWTLDEIRQTLDHIDDLRAKGLLAPLKRYVAMDWVKKDKRGKYYVASEEQLREELAMQRRSSIDSNGNLVVDGQITKYGWLASFEKKE